MALCRVLRSVFEGPALQTPPKFHEKTPREEQKKATERGEKVPTFGRRRFLRERGGSKGVGSAEGPGEGQKKNKVLKPNPSGSNQTLFGFR